MLFRVRGLRNNISVFLLERRKYFWQRERRGFFPKWQRALFFRGKIILSANLGGARVRGARIFQLFLSFFLYVQFRCLHTPILTRQCVQTLLREYKGLYVIFCFCRSYTGGIKLPSLALNSWRHFITLKSQEKFVPSASGVRPS